MSFATEEKVCYKRKKRTEHDCIRKKEQPVLARADQFKARFEPDDVEMPKEELEETDEEKNETEQNMKESGKDVTDFKKW